MSTVSPDFPQSVVSQAPFPLIYSFDVFVHVDLHTFYHTLLNLKKLMNEKSRFIVSVANLCSELGFERFSKQKEFKVAGFYCKTLLKFIIYSVMKL